MPTGGYFKKSDGTFGSIANFTKEEIEALADETIRSKRMLAAHAMTPMELFMHLRPAHGPSNMVPH
ncbi:MAG: hypothetical protein WDN75_00285 [Bacteroidota bacterium]